MGIKQTIGTNYHNSLIRLSENFDPVMHRFRKSYEDTQNQGWMIPLVLKLVPDVRRMMEAVKNLDSEGIVKSLSSVIPSVGIIGIPFAVPYLGVSSVVGFGISGLILFISLSRYLWLMTQLDSTHFHIGAYRFLKRREYDLFTGSFLFSDFSFKGLLYVVNHSLNGEGELNKTFERLKNEFDSFTFAHQARYEEKESHLLKQNNELEAELLRQKEVINSIITKADQSLHQLYDELSEANLSSEYMADLLDRLITILYRYRNGRFSVSDLKLIADFTIYKVEGGHLIKIADEGTSGHSLGVISMDSKEHATWAAVQVVTTKSIDPLFNEPRKNYYIASYLMRMGNNELWVYNLHFHRDRNKKAVDLTIHDIIDNKLLFRLIHVLCLLLQSTGFPKKEESSDDHLLSR
ncbi:hypothetical protein E1B06_21475 [Brevibacillus laterosporus]|uniref:hypothetical protein n=1 Tax=Brevibacillus laterosporus TaxID=1465 RepID=UPI0024051DC4|nr:hypothetical protein [Brevibacillus laterosporus]MDF9414211.1 hypothetical protein [Brevibacillus laterosporus]